MHGAVKVSLVVDQTTGNTSTIFTFTLASAAQDGYVYDVQKKRNGRWRSWMSAVTDTSAMFQARRPGTYRFRSLCRVLPETRPMFRSGRGSPP